MGDFRRSLRNIIPPGTIVQFASNSIPANYLRCNGQEIDQSDYQGLFNEIGYTYSPYSSGSKFKVPDLQGLFVRCTDSQSAPGDTQEDSIKQHDHSMQSAGSHSHAMLDAGSHTHVIQFEGSHNHTVQAGTHSSDGERGAISQGEGSEGQDTHETLNAGSHNHEMTSAGSHFHTLQPNGGHTHTIDQTGGTETRPKNMALVYMIKY